MSFELELIGSLSSHHFAGLAQEILGPKATF